MKLYRFSPIQNKDQLLETIKHIHLSCFALCEQVLGQHLPINGNIGVFCHYEEEYTLLTKFREELTEPSDDPNQKYYLLKEPIVIAETTYTHLYIRKPDPYRSQVGDIDFLLDREHYTQLKQSLPKGARLFERPELDMIELYDPDVDVLAYVRCTPQPSIA